MSDLQIVDSKVFKRSETPPLFSELYSENSCLLRLNNKQTDEIADRPIVDLDPQILSALIIAGIRSDNLRLITKVLAKGVTISAAYVLEATTAKRKEILLELFGHGWDVNQPIGPMTPPILA
ncbi:hypothetical protein VI817_000170 [Penicillium citrinum]|nr:hypothetical protein VI817_000170 [Penicillium citrinum]